MLEPEEAIETLYPGLWFNEWRNGVIKGRESQFGFPRNRPQDKDLRVSGLFERFSPEMSAGKWACGMRKGRKPVNVHFQENYCCGSLELSPLRDLRQTAHTLPSSPAQRARKLGYFPIHP